jgi:stage IV sporulation protein FB
MNKTKIKINPLGVISLLIMYFLNGNDFFLMFLCALLHEAGHLLAMGICKVKPAVISLGFLNFNIEYNKSKTTYKKDIFISLAGPMINLILAVCGIIEGSESFFYVNLILFSINILPVRTLDGGNALKSALALFEKNGYERLYEKVIGVCVVVAFSFLCDFNVSAVFSLVATLVTDEICFSCN